MCVRPVDLVFLYLCLSPVYWFAVCVVVFMFLVSFMCVPIMGLVRLCFLCFLFHIVCLILCVFVCCFLSSLLSVVYPLFYFSCVVIRIVFPIVIHRMCVCWYFVCVFSCCCCFLSAHQYCSRSFPFSSFSSLVSFSYSYPPPRYPYCCVVSFFFILLSFCFSFLSSVVFFSVWSFLFILRLFLCSFLFLFFFVVPL